MKKGIRAVLAEACGSHINAVEDLFKKMNMKDENADVVFASIFLYAAEGKKLKKALKVILKKWEDDWQYKHPELRTQMLKNPAILSEVYTLIGLRPGSR